MALIPPRQRARGDIPTSSMADIAFLLLIFFLVTTVFPKDRGLALVLPQEREVPVSAQNVLHLMISASGEVEIRRGNSPQSQLVGPEAVGEIWREELALNHDLIAAVKTHEHAAYWHMVEVLDELTGAGAVRISLEALPR